jgi:hypothetical protein
MISDVLQHEMTMLLQLLLAIILFLKFNKNFTDLWGIMTTLDLFLVLGSVDKCFQIATAFPCYRHKSLHVIYYASFLFLPALNKGNIV